MSLSGCFSEVDIGPIWGDSKTCKNGPGTHPQDAYEACNTSLYRDTSKTPPQDAPTTPTRCAHAPRRSQDAPPTHRRPPRLLTQPLVTSSMSNHLLTVLMPVYLYRHLLPQVLVETSMMPQHASRHNQMLPRRPQLRPSHHHLLPQLWEALQTSARISKTSLPAFMVPDLLPNVRKAFVNDAACFNDSSTHLGRIIACFQSSAVSRASRSLAKTGLIRVDP